MVTPPSPVPRPRSADASAAVPTGPAPASLFVGVPRLSRPVMGREDELARLAALRDRVGATLPAVVLPADVGCGGWGTSALAAEYAHRARRSVPLVCWVEAGGPDLLPVRLGRLARLASGHGRPDRGAPVLSRVLESRGEPWLLVIDGVDDPSWLDGLLPRRGPGQVVVTSRTSAWPVREANRIPIGPLPRPASAALLASLAPGTSPDAAGAIAALLADHPLALGLAALALAGGSVAPDAANDDDANDHDSALRASPPDGAASGADGERYRRRLERVADRLAHTPVDAVAEGMCPQLRIAVTEALLRASDACPSAPLVLGVLAHLGPAPFTRSAATDALAALPGVDDPEVALDALRVAGLVTTRGGVLAVPRAVQDVARADWVRWLPSGPSSSAAPVLALRLADDLLERAGCGVAVDGIESRPEDATGGAADPSDLARSGAAPPDWPPGESDGLDDLLIHALAALAAPDAAGEPAEPAVAARVRARCGRALASLDVIPAATALLRPALVAACRDLGAGHPDAMAVTGALADVLVSGGDLGGARPVWDQLHRHARQLYGGQHSLTVAAREVLSWLDEVLGGPRPADRDDGDEDGEVFDHEAARLASLNRRAEQLYDRGRLDEAADVLREVLVGCARHFGERDVSTTVVAWNFLGILRELGADAEADALLGQHLRWLVGADERSLSAQQRMARRLLIGAN